jgi:hypothetical protein
MTLMPEICLGAYATLEDAEAAKALRPEPQNELSIVEDGDPEHPFRIWWHRPI